MQEYYRRGWGRGGAEAAWWRADAHGSFDLAMLLEEKGHHDEAATGPRRRARARRAAGSGRSRPADPAPVYSTPLASTLRLPAGLVAIPGHGSVSDLQHDPGYESLGANLFQGETLMAGSTSRLRQGSRTLACARSEDELQTARVSLRAAGSRGAIDAGLPSRRSALRRLVSIASDVVGSRARLAFSESYRVRTASQAIPVLAHGDDVRLERAADVPMSSGGVTLSGMRPQVGRRALR